MNMPIPEVHTRHTAKDQTRFAALWRDAKGKELVLSRTELELFLEGSAVVGRIPLSPAPLQRSDLRRFSA